MKLFAGILRTPSVHHGAGTLGRALPPPCTPALCGPAGGRRRYTSPCNRKHGGWPWREGVGGEGFVFVVQRLGCEKLLPAYLCFVCATDWRTRENGVPEEGGTRCALVGLQGGRWWGNGKEGLCCVLWGEVGNKGWIRRKHPRMVSKHRRVNWMKVSGVEDVRHRSVLQSKAG